MKVSSFIVASTATAVVASLCIAAVVFGKVQAPPNAAQLQKFYQSGNYKEAFEGYRSLLLEPKTKPSIVAEELPLASNCLLQLARLDELDAFREKVVEAHPASWQVLTAVAQNYLDIEHQGYTVAGAFHRGYPRGAAQYMNAAARDRVRALQLLVEAVKLTRKGEDRQAAAAVDFALARALLYELGGGGAWRLQVLTDLTTLPDYEEGWYNRDQLVGTPVDEEGSPVFHHVPKSLEAAKSDGERWRWALADAFENNPGAQNTIRFQLAGFFQSQFDVQTIGYGGYELPANDDVKKDESGPYAVHTLGEDETIARLATGVKRFKLPDEFNFIKIFKAIADDPKTGHGEDSLNTLASIFENRRQFDKAADYWKRSRKEYGDQNYKQARIDQILGNWGRFEVAPTQPAGKGATVEFRFRNGNAVEFEAREVLVPKLLDDLKAYLKSNPAELDWNKLNIGNVGYRLVEQNEKQYLGRRVASWKLDLKPPPKHFDDRVTVTTPLQKAGAYLVTAKMTGGNTSRIIVWVNDTVILKKNLADKSYYYVADATTGAPIGRANLEFFGYQQKHVPNQNKWFVETTNFAERTDADGQATTPPNAATLNYQWLITARTDGGRFAHLGFTNIWANPYYDPQYEQDKVFTITDRPVYRPKQPVRFKFWVRHAKYDQDDVSSFANQAFVVEIRNPKGEKVFTKNFTADGYGGFDGEYELPSDASLGVYQLLVVGRGGGSFRVEEYKKPEFEVAVDAPKEPVMLGEKITASINAKYLFGAPVTQAKVKYKITRTSYNQAWYPHGEWDWLYGPGYWWYAHDYSWYPGWHRWGCIRPHPFWFPFANQPPEVVAEAEVPIGADGTLKVVIDTAAAKAVHADQDHQYQITVEVTDQSRRTIVGTGNVMVARRPFQVFAWVDRGYFRVGDDVHAHFKAQTLDHKPVQGKGTLQLLKVTYDEKQEPIETPVQKWDLDTNAQGEADVQVKAAESGQYRFSYKVTDAKEHTIEGGYVFSVVGEGNDGSGYRFNDVELTADKREYQPGDKVRLMINTNRVGGVVVLFTRPVNGVYLPPKVVRLDGKTTIQEIEVSKKDMPNFFVEAITVADGKLHSDVKEIVVPPEKRILNVEVDPSQPTYKPGQKAKVKVKLTDLLGKPFVGSTVMTIYDKSVEYISGGSNVGDIKSFFWNWRRTHYPQSESNLDASGYSITRSNEISMQDLGAFGSWVLGRNQNGHMMGFGGMGGARRRSATRERDLASERGGEVASLAAGAGPRSMLEGEFSKMKAPGSTTPADKESGVAGEGGPPIEPTMRKNFADTAYWAGSITTDQNGHAEVDVEMPESLTTWKVKVWGMGHGTKVGQGEAEVLTTKDLLIRLQAPRFFVQKDEVVLSANVHNKLDHPKRVQVVLELGTNRLQPLEESVRSVEIEANGETRVDWKVRAVEEGEAVVRMKAITDEESDAMEMRFPVYVHGMLKTESFAGVIRPDEDSANISVKVPEERRIEQSRLEIRYSPTLAGAMVDALPYMVDYPYGCTEQTLNRFLPTVITQKILMGMQLDLKAIRDKRTNLNAQEIGDDAERAKRWKRFDRNPVFDEAEVASMVKEGLRRLTDMQLKDGGWGWFSGFGEHSDPHTTALVVHGLQLTKKNDVAIVPGVLEHGVEWLKRHQDEEVRRLQNFPARKDPWKEKADNMDAFVYMVLIDAGVKNPEMLGFLDRDRTNLAVYAKAMFGIALEAQGEREKLGEVLRNLGQYVVQDDENQTAFLRLPENNYWWYWYGSEYEAHAYYLKLLSRTEPKGRTPSRLVKYLLNNRKNATYWNSTRDTAVCIEAMAEYLKASGEDKPDMAVTISIDGKDRKEVKITAANLFTFSNQFVLSGEEVTSGRHRVEFKKVGRGPLYFNTYLTNFTLEDPIKRAGLEIKVNRKVFKLVKEDKSIKASGSRGQAVDQKVEKYRRVQLADDATLKSGDLVEVELEIDSKNDYEYLIFEDMKAAGFEAVEVRSGYGGNALGAYMELRDERVSFFLRTLARGKSSVSYRLRAEIPGKFSALPTRAFAMYAPELKANSDEIKLNIED